MNTDILAIVGIIAAAILIYFVIRLFRQTKPEVNPYQSFKHNWFYGD
jgi:hypothetical protein